jgi:hypothetical protein
MTGYADVPLFCSTGYLQAQHAELTDLPTPATEVETNYYFGCVSAWQKLKYKVVKATD